MAYPGEGVDRRIIQSGDIKMVMDRLQAIFDNRGVPTWMNLDGSRVSSEARLVRLAHQILQGDVSFQAVRRSVDRIAEANGQRTGQGRDERIMRDRDPEEIRDRIEAIFRNRGVDLGLRLDGTLIDPDTRLDRLVDEVLSGASNFNKLRASVDRIAEAFPHGPETPGETSTDRRAREEQDAEDRRRAAEQSAAVLMDRLAMFFDPGEAAALSKFATDMIIEGANDAEIMQELRQHEIYRERFPAMEERIAAGYAPITEAEYVQLEGAYQRIMRNAGVPEGFYDGRDDFAQFISSDVSPHELSTRVEKGYVAALNADPSVRRALSEFYGVSEGALAAFFIDPDRAWSSIERKLRSAQIGSAAQLSGFGDLERSQAEMVAGLGIDEREARQGFSQLEFQSALMTGLPGESGHTRLDDEDQLRMQFAQDAKLRQRLERNRNRRLAVFEGGGGSVANTGGLTGLGTSNV